MNGQQSGRRALWVVGALVLGAALAGRAGAQGIQAGGAGSPATGIIVHWERPSGIPGGDGPFGKVLGYVILRTDRTGDGIPVQVGGTLGDQRTFRDQIFVTHNVPNVYAWGAPGADPGQPVTLTNVPGLIAGHTYVYQVQTAYETLMNPDFSLTPHDLLSPLSGSSNPATAVIIGQITSLSQMQAVDPSNIEVEFTTTSGADMYQVLVSRNLRFTGAATVRGRPVQVVPPDLGGLPTTTASVNASKLVRGNRPLFVTVLAWPSRQKNRPKPFGGVTYPPIEVIPVTAPPPGP